MGSTRLPPAFANFPMAYDDARARGVYRAVCQHVVDGDTLDVFADLGLFEYCYVTLRLAGIDTPELTGGDRERGLAARDRTMQLVLGRPVCVRTYKDATTFGRFVADVFYQSETRWLSLADTLRADGHVK